MLRKMLQIQRNLNVLHVKICKDASKLYAETASNTHTHTHTHTHIYIYSKVCYNELCYNEQFLSLKIRMLQTNRFYR
jgi:hypothetical protein